jgi:DNA end-binding protein Ku
MARPYWSGQFQLSLVSFGIQLFPATEAKSEIHFHQLNRHTGERIKHQNVSSDDDPVDKEEIVKGYEYSKGEYVMIEPEDIENLRIPSRQTLDVAQFVERDELDPKFFEKPYFVSPENPTQAEAFAVVRKAMQTAGKVAVGKIAFGGREHLVAVFPPEDDKQLGMMAYTMRYAEELRDPAEYFENIKRVAIDEDQLALAKELIKRKSAPFDPGKFTDEYETALREMIDAKVKHAPLPKNAPAAKSTKVVNLMDALRKSLNGADGTSKKTASATKSRNSFGIASKEGRRKNLSVITSAKRPAAKAAKASNRSKSA